VDPANKDVNGDVILTPTFTCTSAQLGNNDGTIWAQFESGNSTYPSSTYNAQTSIWNNTIGGTQTIIKSGSPYLSGSTPQGGDGTYSYQWESSTNNINFSPIPVYTYDCSPGTISQTTYYRRKVNSGDVSESVSNVITITIIPYQISIGTISPLTYCTGSTISVAYTVNTSASTGNIFTAQLSNATGSFSSPVSIGTVSSTSSGTIAATIPSTSVAGVGYRIRVIGSSPVTTGSINASNITLIAPQSIATNTISPLQYCAGATVNIPFTTNCGSFNTGNIFTAQLSDATGSFSSPVSIGTLSATSSGTVIATIPSNPVSGSVYRVRVIASSPSSIGTDNGTNLTLIPLNIVTNAVSSLQYCVGATVSIPFTANCGVFNAGNVFTAQLSNATGSFSSPVSIGTLSGTSSGTVVATIPSNSVAGSAYRVRVIASSPSLTASDNGTNITLIPLNIVTNAVSPLQYCVGATVSIPFTANCGVFNAGNVFTAQLSDTTGSFSSPVSIGTLSATSSGTVVATIPSNAVAGSAYRVRVIASSPSLTAANNGANITLIPLNITTNVISPLQYCTGSTMNISFTANCGTLNAGNIFTAQLSDAFGSFAGAVTSLGTLTGTSSGTISWTTTANIVTGTKYRVRVVSSNPVLTGTDNGSDIVINPINFIGLSSSVICPGSSFPIQFSYPCQTFNAGNIFTAQLSDGNGVFSASPMSLGTVTSTGGLNTISGIIPNNITVGTGYRVRIVSSNPVIIESDNGTDLTTCINTCASFTQIGSKLVVPSDALGSYIGFGTSVAISADGNTAVVGGPGDNGNIGAVWIYTRNGTVWVQQGNKLVGTGGIGFANSQGNSVAISDDGNTIAVGGPSDNYPSGAIWVFTRTNRVWAQKAKLTPTGYTSGPQIGQAVAISGDGNTILAGGPGDKAAWVFAKTGSTWAQQGTKLAGTGGSSVALSYNGSIAVIGSIYDNVQTAMGAAWVSSRTGTTWSQPSKLPVTGSIVHYYGDDVGEAVSISADGNIIAVGGDGDRDNHGAVWMFIRTNPATTQWVAMNSTINNSNKIGFPLDQLSAGNFGAVLSISASGNSLLVGGDFNYNGAVWLFTRAGNNWIQQGSKIMGTGSIGSNAKQGCSISLSKYGNTAIIGGLNDGASSTANPGAAWMFGCTENDFKCTALSENIKLAAITTGTDPAIGPAKQGVALAISADGYTAIVGGYSDNSNQGAAWIYVKNGGVWTEQKKLIATGNIGPAAQGIAVAISADGNTVVSAGRLDNGGIGAVWVFTRSGTTWTQGQKLVGTGNLGNSNQGSSVAISGDASAILVGGFLDNGNTGASWLWRKNVGGTYTAQTTSAGVYPFVGMPHLNGAQGISVDLSYDGFTAVIGALNDDLTNQYGAAFIWRLTQGGWQQQTKIAGGYFMNLGTSVSISDDGKTVALGGQRDQSYTGVVQIWISPDFINWTQQGTNLYGTTAIAGSYFGSKISLSPDGNTLLVGGLLDGGGKGATWLFTRSGTTWTQRGAKMLASDIVGNAEFGSAVSLSTNGEVALIGGSADGTVVNTGAVWMYQCSTSTNARLAIQMDDPVIMSDVSSTINLYPNPNDGTFNIMINNKDLAEGNLTVINNLGQILVTETIQAEDKILKSLSLDQQPEGLYHVYVRLNNKSFTKTFIIVR
jgi:hypothetical protein